MHSNPQGLIPTAYFLGFLFLEASPPQRTLFNKEQSSNHTEVEDKCILSGLVGRRMWVSENLVL